METVFWNDGDRKLSLKNQVMTALEIISGERPVHYMLDILWNMYESIKFLKQELATEPISWLSVCMYPSSGLFFPAAMHIELKNYNFFVDLW